ncbi:protein kinase protein with tetratricopeptiderepeat domain [Striga asiatica]|uniref:Protein kinase protein with tetratricopeptiderepeat domain n=1 Tax=Striga asiatica TaxID=4170 RepID=A0A5A7QBN4_STRAF|nr:protein kinase protein with tetratricopeptiderepeat domain [Striga asiatica]
MSAAGLTVALSMLAGAAYDARHARLLKKRKSNRAASARGVVGDCGGSGERLRVAATVPAERRDDRCNVWSLASVRNFARVGKFGGGIPRKRPPLLIDRRERTEGLLLKVADEDFSTGSSAVLFANGQGRPLLIDSWV